MNTDGKQYNDDDDDDEEGKHEKRSKKILDTDVNFLTEINSIKENFRL